MEEDSGVISTKNNSEMEQAATTKSKGPTIE